ncbi:hypothetical protein PHLGIDRAFT_129483 [Phlebiopsis gigantea 11061_1 CR5-6]|uniref:DUF6533 domain-containing protein n=1 Tax=Phlebiopsis gigantea (strain 11061_1 CR5-6) TaxID=745531 RepID=A0A0C3PFQ7_PHLG1|nr:hypothetical protein PHLGIDRAFT_129483 [Phlebiopsis gigantea 11061_1 CR5-6]
MENAAQSSALAAAFFSIDALEATKYLSAAGLVCALWDHAITLDDEIELVWKKKWDVTKFAFFFYRYGAEGSLIYVNYMLSGIRPHLSTNMYACKAFAVVLFAAVMLISVSSNVYIAIYHYQLWDRRKGAMIALLVAIACIYGPGIALAVIGMRADYKSTVYVAEMDICLVLSDSAEGTAFWGCMVGFDAFAILLAIVNALDRPYRQSTDVLSSLRRDGAAWFIGLFFLRLMNFVIFLTRPAPQKLLVAFFLWAMVPVTLARLIMRVENIKKASRKVHVWNPLSFTFESGRWSNPL